MGAVGADLERSIRVDFQEVEDGPINYERKAVSVLCELLDHRGFRTSNVSPVFNSLATVVEK